MDKAVQQSLGLGRRQPQKGYTLLEMGLVMALATGLAMMVLSLTMASAESLRSGFVAHQYRMLSQAVAAYMGRHHAALAALPADCDKLALGANGAPAAPTQACQLSGLAGVNVANGLQPTAAELAALNLLEASFSSQAMLPTRKVMRDPKGNLVPATLAVQITKLCGSVPQCTNGYRLQGLVFNQQPYDLERNTYRGGTVRDTLLDAFLALGGGAALASNSALDKELAGYKGLFKVANPLQSASGGVPGVLALRSEFNSLTGVSGSEGWVAQAKTGQLWDFSGQSLRGVSTLAAASLGADQLSTNQLTVNGSSEVQQLNAQSVSAEKIKLPVAAWGQACAPQLQSLAVTNDGSGRLLVCPGSGAWTFQNPSPDSP